MIYDVIIIGGGINGLTIAAALSEHEFNVALIEKKSIATQLKNSRDGRNISIARHSRAILERYNIWDYIASGDVGKIDKIIISDAGSASTLDFDSNIIDGQPLGFLIENDNILKGLYEKVSSHKCVSLFEEGECESITFDSKNAHIQLKNGEQISSKIAIISDGKNSKIRSMLNLSLTSRDYDQVAFVFNVKHEQEHRNYAYEHFFPNGPFALLPMQDPYQSSVIWSEDARVSKLDLSKQDLEDFLLERCWDSHGRAEITSEIFRFPLSLSYMKEYFKNRAVFIGDCLHFIHPLAGQSYNLSLRDIDVLVKLLAEHASLGLDIGSQILLGEFARRRKFDNIAMIGITHSLNTIFCSRFAPLESLRRAGIEAIGSMPFLQKFFMNYAMGSV